MPLIWSVVASLVLSPISLISVSSTGEQANHTATGPAVSADGRFVAFQSFASNLVPGDTNGLTDVFVRDRRTGTTDRVSLTGAGGELSDHSGSGAISADGQYVAFVTAAAELAPGEPTGAPLVYLRDRRAGTTELICTSSAEVPARFECGGPALSADGRYVAFETRADTLVAGDTNDASDVFVRDRLAGTTTRVSVSSSEVPADKTSAEPDVSADGRYVTFTSDATNLGPAHNGEAKNVFIRDRRAGVTTSVAPAGAGDQPLENSLVQPTISDDGRTVAFATRSPFLVPPGTVGYQVLAYDNRR